MLTKCMSFSSVESDQSEPGSRNGLLSRAGTMSEGAVSRIDVSRNKLRPKSELPQGIHTKELEASFEVSSTTQEPLGGKHICIDNSLPGGRTYVLS